MKTIAYCSPLVPPEWIAAHGLRPRWWPGPLAGARRLCAPRRGVCPFAAGLADAALLGLEADAVVLTTICDQMRYAAALLAEKGRLPLFLMNVPSTWQTAGARELYRQELMRMSRFFAELGGRQPTQEELAALMIDYDDARAAVRAAREQLSAREFAEAMVGLRGELSCGAAVSTAPVLVPLLVPRPSRPCSTSHGQDGRGTRETSHGQDGRGTRPALALVGGPLPKKDFALFDLIEHSGGRVVLDATEGGERTLPAPFDLDRTQENPLAELAAAYFDHIPDPFRRPNNRLYEWLGRELAARHVRGVILRRYVWCDLWHAESQRLRQLSPVPVIDIDVDDDDESVANRTMGRIEALLESLTPAEKCSHA